VVDIRGAVTRPGSYDLGESLRLSELIAKADGLLGDAYLARVDVVRVKPDFGEQLIKLNLKQVLAKDLANDIELQGLDRIRVYGMTEMVPKTYVAITGHVKRPGRFLLQENMSLYDLIFKAGGFVDEEFKKRTYLKRAELVRVMEDNDEKKIIPFNLGLVLNKQGLANTALRTDDAVRIYSVSEIEGETRYVSIDGHVKRPGQYELFEGNMTLYDLIFKAGGFEDEEYKKLTCLKRAELVRVREDSDEKKIIPFNLGQVLDKQGMADTPLRTDDAIQIYSMVEIEGATRYVSISGQVKRPGQYELFEENMQIHDLLFKAGGFDDPQYKASVFLDRADLIRYEEDRITQTIIPFHLGQVLANERSKHNFKLQSGDEIRVYSQAVFNNVRSVSIDGVVRSPGTYTLKTGMTVKDLILEAGGVSEDVFRYKIEVARVDPKKVDDKTYAETIDLDMYSDYTISNIQYSFDPNPGGVSVERTEFKLHPYDYVSVRPDPYFRMQRKVTVSGAVYFPGVFALRGPHETITDILERAGGLRPKAYATASTMTRNDQIIRIALDQILKKPNSKANVLLQDGDQIFVALKPDMTQILGEVVSPGIYKFISEQRVHDYIAMAGGYTVDAEKKEIWITYPDGRSKHYNRWLSNPKVLDGSIINVGRAKEEEPFDRTEFAKE
ncbi:MAG: SLBB domain-containing protein, partial [Candidatus Marinimicrobia bacterium]|nr:SLBB domain-containing protein [Candidatus Neomarinimicrobiota bacterium]